MSLSSVLKNFQRHQRARKDIPDRFGYEQKCFKFLYSSRPQAHHVLGVSKCCNWAPTPLMLPAALSTPFAIVWFNNSKSNAKHLSRNLNRSSTLGISQHFATKRKASSTSFTSWIWHLNISKPSGLIFNQVIHVFQPEDLRSLRKCQRTCES